MARRHFTGPRGVVNAFIKGPRHARRVGTSMHDYHRTRERMDTIYSLRHFPQIVRVQMQKNQIVFEYWHDDDTDRFGNLGEVRLS